jgi:predicted transcriptional regulator
MPSLLRQRVEDLGTGKDVKADQKDVVGEQHEASECVSNSALSKGVVSKITYWPTD